MMMHEQNGTGRERCMTARALALIVTLLFCLGTGATAQTIEWGRFGHGPGWKHTNTVAMDSHGNSFIGGEMCDSMGVPLVNPQLDFGDDYKIADANSALVQGFIMVYNHHGHPTCLHRIAADPGCIATVKSLAVHGTHLYVTGNIQGRVDFGNGDPRLMIMSSAASSSFLAKYTINTQWFPFYYKVTSLTCEWVTTFEPKQTAPGLTNYLVALNSIAVDRNGDPYVCGGILGSASGITHVPGGTPVTTPINNAISATTRAMIVKCDRDNGTVRWHITNTESPSGSVKAYANGIAVTDDLNIVITGYYFGSPVFGTSTLPATTARNLLVAQCRVNLSGNPQWKWASTSIQQPDSSSGNAVAVDISGNAYVTGEFSGAMKLTPSLSLSTPGSRTFFIARYSPIGTVTWAESGRIGATGDAFANGVVTLDDAIYITGSFSDTMWLDTTMLGSMGNHDVFVAKYAAVPGTSSCNVEWVQRAGNVWDETSQGITSTHFDQGRAIAVTPHDEAIVTGEFGDSVFSLLSMPDRYHHNPRNIFTVKFSLTTEEIHGFVHRNGGIPCGNQIVTAAGTHGGTHYATTHPDGFYKMYMSTSEALEHDKWIPTRDHLLPNNFTLERVYDKGCDTCYTPSIRVDIIPQSTEFAPPYSVVKYFIRFQNVGTTDLDSATLKLEHDPHLTHLFSRASSTGIIGPGQSGSTLIWNLPTLPPLAQGQISVEFQLGVIPSGLPQQITSDVTMMGAGEIQTRRIQQEVVQPNDPNGKYVNPQGNLSGVTLREGIDLEYTLTFVNNGNGSVTSITIDDHMKPPAHEAGDTGRINITGSKPDCFKNSTTPDDTIVFTTDCRPGPVLRAVHESIHDHSGFLTFTMPLKRSLPIGTAIHNRATVYFDGKEPGLATNEVVTCILPDFAIDTGKAGDTTRFIIRGRYDDSTRADSLKGVMEYLYDSSKVASCRWDFGDGTDTTIQQQALRDELWHIYGSADTYVVTVRIVFNTDVVICDMLTRTYTIRKEITIR